MQTLSERGDGYITNNIQAVLMHRLLFKNTSKAFIIASDVTHV
ncbi:hypothetical protein DFR42_101640 [Undibacterium pigrum]|uniref:Uncharacterized protein n=1 Tax=Undibacterium pigrum TaxID=401470 RepID=A0A318K184_9BURK|nr:hypothetical protein DFR42_101640 [Undibacterium pigrum]